MSDSTAPQQIEAQIAASRTELGTILGEIERKLAPRQILDRGIDMLRDRVSTEAGGLGDNLLRHPAPVALIGLGLGWLLLSHGAQAPAQPYPTEGADYAHARTKPEPIPDPAESAPKRDGMGVAMAEHPLALGALAFIAGAALSLLLPRSTVERAERLAGRAVDTAMAMVKDAVGNGREG